MIGVFLVPHAHAELEQCNSNLIDSHHRRVRAIDARLEIYGGRAIGLLANIDMMKCQTSVFLSPHLKEERRKRSVLVHTPDFLLGCDRERGLHSGPLHYHWCIRGHRDNHEEHFSTRRLKDQEHNRSSQYSPLRRDGRRRVSNFPDRCCADTIGNLCISIARAERDVR